MKCLGFSLTLLILWLGSCDKDDDNCQGSGDLAGRVLSFNLFDSSGVNIFFNDTTTLNPYHVTLDSTTNSTVGGSIGVADSNHFKLGDIYSQGMPVTFLVNFYENKMDTFRFEFNGQSKICSNNRKLDVFFNDKLVCNDCIRNNIYKINY